MQNAKCKLQNVKRILRVGRKAESISNTACLLLLFVGWTVGSTTVAQPFSFEDIQFWVGSGMNRAALAIDWHDNATDPPALVWGYRWNGVAHGDDMLTAVVAADRRLFAKLGGSRAEATAVYGLGYDANGDGQFGIDDGTAFDEQGFAFTRPADLATSVDSADYYAEGWFTGFWHYGVSSANPYAGGAWSDTAVGMASRQLTDGAWDSWVFSPTFDFGAFADNPVAAPPPYSPGDFNQDGRVDANDYGLWRRRFGSSSDLAADGNGNGIVDAADYVLWRKYAATSAIASSASPLPIPEPCTELLTLCSLCALWQVRLLQRRAKFS